MWKTQPNIVKFHLIHQESKQTSFWSFLPFFQWVEKLLVNNFVFGFDQQNYSCYFLSILCRNWEIKYIMKKLKAE